MAELVLNDSLIDEYIKYKFSDDFDVNKVRKLLKFIHPFALKLTHPIMQDPAMPMALENDPLIEIIESCSDEDMVQNSSLKLMLTDSLSSVSFTTLNIVGLTQKLTVRYSGIYMNALDKNKAQIHIKSLLSDAKWIKIIDGYIASQGKQNKNIIQDIIPLSSLDLTIVGASKDNGRMQINQTEKDQLNLICNNWNIRANQLTQNMHDRYIETDKLKILLSSGLYNLSISSNKDFTYVVDLK